MNLKDFLASRDKPPELFWSLVLEPGWVQAGIWYIGETAAEVISVGPGAAWEVDDELIGAVDAALSSAVAKLPEEYKEPSKTVFGVPSSWVKGGEIEEERLGFIKKICTDLSLTPVGFVVLTEAIAHLCKSEEGAPTNAIIIGLGSEFLELSVFKLGNLAGTTKIARSVSLIEDVTEGLSRFEGATPLPSRFIIFDGKGGELDEAKEALMQANWDENPKFLHAPKVETLASDRKVLAVALAGANEMGDVSQVKSQDPEEDKIPTEEVENVVPIPPATALDLGFEIGKDISETLPPAPKAHLQEDVSPVIHAPPKISPTVLIDNYFQKLKNFFGDFSKKVSGPRLGKKPMMNLGTILGVIIIGLGFFWWFYPHARVTIYVTPKSFQEESDVTFNVNGESDPSAGAIPAQTLSTKVEGDKTSSATGSKLIGDKAKGEVVIGNTTKDVITLSAGTLLISSGGLNFTLDNSASVSAALDSFHNGTTSASVTAADIGAQYNLGKDEVFRVGNYIKTNVSAQSTSDFSGGSSQQISAVSTDDQKKLETGLTEELRQNAILKLSSQISDDRIFIEDLSAFEVLDRNFDHKVGDAADSLRLSLSMDATAVAADKTRLLDFAKGILKDKIPQGFVLRDSQVSFKFTFVSQADGNVKYKVIIGANFLPQVDTNAIIKKISGKTPGVTEDYLVSVPGFSRADVTLSPKFPGPLGVLPWVTKNITLEIVAEN